MAQNKKQGNQGKQSQKPNHKSNSSSSNKKRKGKGKPSTTEKLIKEGVNATKSAAKLVESIRKKDIYNSIVNGADVAGKVGNGIYHIVQAIRERSNPKGWYIKYKQIEPAKNLGRQMAPRFNKSITNNPTQGSISRFIDVEMQWADYTNSFAFDQTVTNSYQLLRIKLKSNLPYKRGKLKAYVINAIALAIMAKEVERDMAWRNFSHPDIYNFPEMFISRNNGNANGYGIIPLQQEEYLKTDNWATSISNYDRLRRLVNTNVRVAPSLMMFISHYFGSVFTDSDDQYNTQFIINRMHQVPWATYDSDDDTITISTIDITDVDIQQFSDMVVNLGVEYGMVIADLVNSEQYVSLEMDDVTAGYMHTMVYDKSFLQALINAYTSRSAATEAGYIRMDQMSGVEDDLTQYIFMGGLQVNDAEDLNNMPTIRVLSMTYKIDSDASLQWPTGITQISTLDEYFTSGEPFGIAICTDISQDTYIKSVATASVTSGSALNVPVSGRFTLAQIGLSAMTSIVAAASFNDGHSTSAVTVISTGGGINFTVNASTYTINFYASGSSTPPKQAWYSGGTTQWTFFIPVCSMLVDQKELIFGYWGFAQFTGPTNGLKQLGNLTAATFYVSDQSIGFEPFKVYFADPSSSGISGAPPSIPKTGANGFWNGAMDDYATQVVFDVYYNATTGQVWPTTASYVMSTGQKAVTWSINTAATSQSTKYEVVLGLGSNIASVSSITATGVAATTADGIVNTAITSGYTLLPALTADWFDYHLPMYIANTVHTEVRLDGIDTPITEQHTLASTPVLVKEAYIPYFYNLLDLVPTLYDMWVSLLTPRDDIYQMLVTPKGKSNKSKEDGIKSNK